jgi:RHS repeat-associated protein
MTDIHGTPRASYTYDSFGNDSPPSPPPPPSSITNPFRYTGREDDGQTGLYFYHARYYDPSTGRFLSEDPVDFAGGVNFFLYVRNDVIKLVDPLGLCELSPRMKECLEKLFKKSVDSVKIVPKVKNDSKWSATTSTNKIIPYVPCEEFLAGHRGVLEEYYHVLEQWNTGRLTRFKYAVEYLKHGYDNNRFEIEAMGFADQNAKEFENCLSCKAK